MKKLLLIPAFLLMLSYTNAQNVGINTTGAAPDAGAGLDVSFTNKGLLVPRVSIANLNTIAPVTGSATESLLVYNTNGTTGTGFHYWNGAQWVRMAISGDAWSLTGNAGTNAGTNFLGTTDNVALRFRTNNTNRFEMSTDGRLRSFNNGSAGAPTYSWNADTDIGMYRPTTNQLGFSTAGTERIRIVANGNVGVNTIPNANNNMFTTVQASTAGTAGWFNTTANSNWVTLEGSSASTTQGTGVSGIGFNGVNGSTTAAAGWAGYFDWDTYIDYMFYGGATLVSDKRLKKNYQDITNATEIISKLNPMLYEKVRGLFENDKISNSDHYKPKETYNLEYGFLAQDVEEILPELVREKGFSLNNGEKMNVKGVNYTMIIPILTKAFQEQQTIIETQNKKITDLEERIRRLESLIEE